MQSGRVSSHGVCMARTVALWHSSAVAVLEKELASHLKSTGSLRIRARTYPNTSSACWNDAWTPLTIPMMLSSTLHHHTKGGIESQRAVINPAPSHKGGDRESTRAASTESMCISTLDSCCVSGVHAVACESTVSQPMMHNNNHHFSACTPHDLHT